MLYRKILNNFLPVLMSGLVLSVSTAFAGTFSDDFSSGLNPNYWTITSQTYDFNTNTINPSTPGLFAVNTSQGEVNIANVDVAGQTGYVANGGGITLNLGALGGNISGDFTVQVNFSNAILGPANDQVHLTANFADGNLLQTFEEPTIVSPTWGVNTNGQAGAYDYSTPYSSSGMFEISRTGSIVTGITNPYTSLSEIETAPLTSITLSLWTLYTNPDLPSVSFSNFSITSPTVNAVPIPSAIWLFGSALAGFTGFNRRKTIQK